MSNRKTWAWTDDSSILRNRITVLNRELDEQELEIKKLRLLLDDEHRTSQQYHRTLLSISSKLSKLQLFTSDHL